MNRNMPLFNNSRGYGYGYGVPQYQSYQPQYFNQMGGVYMPSPGSPYRGDLYSPEMDDFRGSRNQFQNKPQDANGMVLNLDGSYDRRQSQFKQFYPY